MADSVTDLICQSDSVSCDGYRNGDRYIALIPEKRYADQSEILQSLIDRFFRPPKPYTPNPQVEEEKPEKRPAPILISNPRPNPDYFNVVVGGMKVPAHMSGWSYGEIVAWTNADGHKDLEEAIVALHEMGA